MDAIQFYPPASLKLTSLAIRVTLQSKAVTVRTIYRTVRNYILVTQCVYLYHMISHKQTPLHNTYPLGYNTIDTKSLLCGTGCIFKTFRRILLFAFDNVFA